MVYSNKFVMCLLVNNEIQQEKANGVITIPFGSEYILRFRNKHNRRAVVQIYIDGENVSDSGYIIDGNSSIDIKRHSCVDKSFKFVDLNSSEAIEYGKNGPNPDKIKGTIVARFYLEKEQKHIVNYPPFWITPYPDKYKKPQTTWNCQNTSHMECSNNIRGQSMICDYESNSISHNIDSNLQDGCTVEGSITGQHFYTKHIDIEDSYTSVKIFLQGYTNTQTIKPDIYCSNCGANFNIRVLKKAKFCPICGHKR